MVRKAREQIESEREAALRDIRAQVALLSVEVAEKVLRSKLDGDAAQQALLEKLTDEAAKNARN